MKILKRPKIKPVKCSYCGAELLPKQWQVEKSISSVPHIYCPICKARNDVKYEVKDEKRND